MTGKLLLIVMASLAVGLPPAIAQDGAGKPFGARDPRTCASRKEPAQGAPTAAQLKQYFICDYEIVNNAWSTAILNLITGVTLEVGKGRPFNILTDSFPSIDPTETVYPIQGAYTLWSCGELGKSGNEPGHSCGMKYQNNNAEGICYKDSFANWHCKFLGKTQTITNACPGAGGATICRLPPPTAY